MVELALLGFLGMMLGLGFRRPFLWVLAYIYVDVLAPQKIGWIILPKLQVSLVVFVAAFAGWLLLDNKQGARFTGRQALMLLLLIYCGITTVTADYPQEALAKWSWVWKALVFAIFLPLALRTRLRIEAAALVMALSAGAVFISAGIKTILTGGGGYGSLTSFITDNTGLYEGSTMSMAAISVIPLVLWLMNHGTVFPPDKRVRLFCIALVFACLLVPVGTQTRTGLLCIAVLGVLSLRTMKRRLLYIALTGAAALVVVPFLPDTYTARMGTIENHQADTSASTRIAVWQWTFDYAKDHPFGGGFEAYIGNKISYETKKADTAGSTTEIATKEVTDAGRAYHSAYFEMLGEQGWPGLALWLLIHGLGVIQMEIIYRRYRRRTAPGETWQAPLAMALQQGQIVFFVGALFIGIAYQPFAYMLVGLQIALSTYVRRTGRVQRAPIGAAARRTMTPLGTPTPA